MKQIKSHRRLSNKEVLPPDKLFKSLLADTMLTSQLLENYVVEEGCSDKVDLNHIVPQPTEYIDPSTCEYCVGDMNYLVPHRNMSSEQLSSVVQLEIQSTIDPLMILRNLKYCVNNYLKLARNRKRSKVYPLYPTVPVVLYTGRSPWNAHTDIQQAISQQDDGNWKGLKPLQFNYILLDAPRLDVRGGANSLIAQFVRCLKFYETWSELPKWNDILETLRKYNVV